MFDIGFSYSFQVKSAESTVVNKNKLCQTLESNPFDLFEW